MKIDFKKALFIFILFLAIGLRLFKLDTLISPYWEEVALGYDAYSISETSRDHHGNYLPIVAFESFGDWKPSGYFYALVPFIKIFGLSIFSTRLPSLIAGIAIVLGIYWLIKLITPPTILNKNPLLPHLGMFIAAISPWAIMFSRAAWEVNLATALILWGVLSFIFFTRTTSKKLLFLILSILLFSASMYTYHSTRILAPFLGLALLMVWFSQQNHSLKLIAGFRKFLSSNLIYLATGLLVSIVLLSPFVFVNSNTTTQRFKETSIFSDISIIEKSNLGQLEQPNILGKIFYHRYLLFGQEILKNFLNHFHPNFLFISGDENLRHSTQYFGQLYHLDIFYLFFGLVFVLSIFRKTHNNHFDYFYRPYWVLLIFWLIIGVIPASLTHASPHALRILPTFPVWIIFLTFGINQLLYLFGKNWKKIIASLVVLGYLFELFVFCRYYFYIYPKVSFRSWQGGYEELISTLNIISKNENQPIYITREQGRPAMYWWFFNKTNPILVQATDAQSKQDQGEFLEFNNFHFVNTLNEITIKNEAILISSPSQIKDYEKNHSNRILILRDIADYQNNIIWRVTRKYE